MNGVRLSVLITGGTGFLGRALVRELLARDNVHRICVFSRDEAKQAAMRASVHDPRACMHYFVGDVRDLKRLTRAMHDVNLVIHTAALKRVEVGEYNPGEMVKTNVLGTMNVIEAAQDAPIDGPYPSPRRVVYVSSDKACEPKNAYGASKLMGEKLIMGAQKARGERGPIYSIVRYGNVAGSTGSVIPTWRTAMAQNQFIGLSDPDATRYWMTIEEAVMLVLDTAATSHGGEIRVPELPAYRLGDLAEAMGLIEPEIVGLGRGEKAHERMLEDGPNSEQARRMTLQELKEGLAQL